MGVSQLKIPKICEQCGKPFEAKTVITRFCSPNCANKSGKEKKQQAKEAEHKQTILEQSADKIAQMQTRPFLSISEATIMFGISKDTIHRLIKAGKIPAFNLGERLTRVSRIHLESIFTAVALPEKPKEKPVKLQYEVKECYTIAEVSEKFGISLSTVSNNTAAMLADNTGLFPLFFQIGYTRSLIGETLHEIKYIHNVLLYRFYTINILNISKIRKYMYV